MVSLPRITIHRAPVHDPKTGQLARTAVLASATLVRQSQLRAVTTTDWQREVWEFYDVVPELHQSAQWWSNALSRVRLYIARNDPDLDCQPITVDNPLLHQPLLDFFHGPTGQAEMLRRVAVHLQVPGETFLIGADTPAGERIWTVASSAELESNTASTYLLTDAAGGRLRLDPDTSMIMRMWYPHAYRSWQSDSPARALRGTLRELQGVSVRISADIESRLAGAGVLFIPDSVTIPRPATTEGANPLHDDPFVDELIRAMVTPISDRDSASAVVPLVARTNGDGADKIKHLSFATPLDDKLLQIRDSAIRRLAVGVDMPPESLLGLSNANHWTAWQISDDAIKLHIEPTMQLICDAITTQYLRPVYARDQLVDNPSEYRVWFTTDDLSQPANRGPEAQSLYALGVIGSKAVRRENGFPDEDAPTTQEATANLAIALAKANPELATRLWDILMDTNPGALANPAIEVTANPEVADATPLPTGSQPASVTSGPPTPGPTGSSAPNNGVPPAQAVVPAAPTATAALADGWMAAVEMGVYRALEVAGRRLMGRSRSYRTRYGGVPDRELYLHIPADKLDTLLDGAYGQLVDVMGTQPCVTRTVDRYVRTLLRHRVPHQRETLATELQRVGCVPGGDRG